MCLLSLFVSLVIASKMGEKSHHLKASLVDHLLERCLFYSGRTDGNQTAALQEFEELTSLVIKIESLEKGSLINVLFICIY